MNPAPKSKTYRNILASGLYLLAGGHAYASCNLTQGGSDKIIQVVDGDTVILSSGKQVRMVGTQAPKLTLNRKNFIDWPLADTAKIELENIVLGKQVTLKYGGLKTDRHRRILAHLFIKGDNGQDIWLQEHMLKQGLARTYSFKDNRSCITELLTAENSARVTNKNIWAHEYYNIIHATDLKTLDQKHGTYQLIEGKLLKFEYRYGQLYFNFGQNYRTDFTINVPKRHRMAFAQSNLDFKNMVGKTIRVRGWLEKRGGPMIEATHPEQLEFLD
ncbi:MAG: thermonuclease family protein [Alphaproteobacteria bacterium]|nr:thermonuclease family protein [Alphaproteobacteria bacterium]